MPADAEKHSLIRLIRAESARTGRRYRIDLEALDQDSLRKLERLLRDLDYDRQQGAEVGHLPRLPSL